MNQLRVTLDIELKPDVVQEALNSGDTEEDIESQIEEHLFQAIGHKSHEGWQFIKEMYTVSIGVS